MITRKNRLLKTIEDGFINKSSSYPAKLQDCKEADSIDYTIQGSRNLAFLNYTNKTDTAIVIANNSTLQINGSTDANFTISYDANNSFKLEEGLYTFSYYYNKGTVTDFGTGGALYVGLRNTKGNWIPGSSLSRYSSNYQTSGQITFYVDEPTDASVGMVGMFTDAQDYTFHFKLEQGTVSHSFTPYCNIHTNGNLFNYENPLSNAHFIADKDGWFDVTLDNTSGSTSLERRCNTLPNLELKCSTKYWLCLEVAEFSGELDIRPVNIAGSQFNDSHRIAAGNIRLGQCWQHFVETKASFLAVTNMLNNQVICNPGKSGHIKFRLSLYEATQSKYATLIYEMKDATSNDVSTKVARNTYLMPVSQHSIYKIVPRNLNGFTYSVKTSVKSTYPFSETVYCGNEDSAKTGEYIFTATKAGYMSITLNKDTDFDAADTKMVEFIIYKDNVPTFNKLSDYYNDTQPYNADVVSPAAYGWYDITLDNTDGEANLTKLICTLPNNNLKPNTKYFINAEVSSSSGSIHLALNDPDTSDIISQFEGDGIVETARSVYLTTKSSFSGCTALLHNYVYCAPGESGQMKFRISIFEAPDTTFYAREQVFLGEPTSNLFNYTEPTASATAIADENGWFDVTIDNTAESVANDVYCTTIVNTKLKPDTEYTILCEVLERSGNGSLYAVSSYATATTGGQFTATWDVTQNNGVALVTRKTRASFENCNTMLRTLCRVEAGKLFHIKFRIAVYEIETSVGDLTGNLFNYTEPYKKLGYITADKDGWFDVTIDNSTATATVNRWCWTLPNMQLKTKTKYTLFTEIAESTGSLTCAITSDHSSSPSQFTGGQIEHIAVGTYTDTITTKSSFDNSTNMLRSCVIFGAGQSGHIKFRIAVYETEKDYFEPYNGIVEYQELEYIEATGNQYIDTKFIPNSNTSLEIKARGDIAAIKASPIQILAGARTAPNEDTYTIIYNAIYSKSYLTQRFDYGKDKIGSKIQRALQDEIITYFANKYEGFINNERVTYTSDTLFSCRYPLYIGGVNTAGSFKSDLGFHGKIYSAKIYDNYNLVRDYVPCLRKPDNAVGMYDKVNNKFYASEDTTHPFVAEPNKENIFEPYNKYKIPVLSNNELITDIYLDNPMKPDEALNCKDNLLPNLPLNSGNNVIRVATEQKPSDMSVTYHSRLFEKSVKEYGVKWAGTSSTVCTRLGDAEGLFAKAHTGSTSYVRNDFDGIYPWKDMRLCNVDASGNVTAYIGEAGFQRDGSNGDVMVEIPKFYYKRIKTGIEEEIWICEKQLPGYSLHPVFVNDGKEVDKVFHSAYNVSIYTDTSDNKIKLKSATSLQPANRQNINTFRTYARNKGTGWGIEDISCISALQMLYLVEYASMNSQSVLGGGIATLQNKDAHIATVAVDNSNSITLAYEFQSLFKIGQRIEIGTVRGRSDITTSPRTITAVSADETADTFVITFDGDPVNIAVGNFVWNVAPINGQCDSLNGRSGWIAGPNIYTNNFADINYRGIEGFHAKLFRFVDGVNFDTNQAYYANSSEDYASSVYDGKYSAIGYTNATIANYASALGYDDKAPWIMFPTEANGTYSTFIPDSYFFGEGQRALRYGGYWSSSASGGVFCYGFNIQFTASDQYTGAHLLLKKPRD